MNGNKRKDEALGMPHGTAANKLRKMIMFSLLKKYGENFCFKCGGEIETVDALSIEHKEPWLSAEEPKQSFFDLGNIAFSHLDCNIRREYFGRVERVCFDCQETETHTRFYNKGLVCASCLAKRDQQIRDERRAREGKPIVRVRIAIPVDGDRVQCKQCLAWKDKDDFHKNPRTSTKTNSFCKVCANTRYREYYKTHEGR